MKRFHTCRIRWCLLPDHNSQATVVIGLRLGVVYLQAKVASDVCYKILGQFTCSTRYSSGWSLKPTWSGKRVGWACLAQANMILLWSSHMAWCLGVDSVQLLM